MNVQNFFAAILKEDTMTIDDGVAELPFFTQITNLAQGGQLKPIVVLRFAEGPLGSNKSVKEISWSHLVFTQFSHMRVEQVSSATRDGPGPCISHKFGTDLSRTAVMRSKKGGKKTATDAL